MGLASTRTCIGMICFSAVLLVGMGFLAVVISQPVLRIVLGLMSASQIVAVALFVKEYRRLAEIERGRSAEQR